MWICAAVTIALCYALEFVRPVVERPTMPTWVWRVWPLDALQVAVLALTLVLWRSPLDAPSLLKLSARCSCTFAGSLGYVAYTFVFSGGIARVMPRTGCGACCIRSIIRRVVSKRSPLSTSIRSRRSAMRCSAAY